MLFRIDHFIILFLIIALRCTVVTLAELLQDPVYHHDCGNEPYHKSEEANDWKGELAVLVSLRSCLYIAVKASLICFGDCTESCLHSTL